MTENELKDVFSSNIKRYRKDKFTQETLAEAIGVSSQNINDIEGKRRFPRTDTLVKIADALNVEVYQLFVPQNKTAVIIEETEENARIRNEIKNKVLEDVQKTLDKTIEKMRRDL